MNVETAVTVLESHPDYRVLRRFSARSTYEEITDGMVLRRGVYIDTETTGVDTKRDDIIELAVVPFLYDFVSGRIVFVDDGVSFLNDPGRPLDDNIRRLTGISDDEVRGQTITQEMVEEACAGATLVVAHNANFDRKMVERFFPLFQRLPWACSQQDVPWRTIFGAIGERLEVLALTQCGVFYDAHRARIDCLVGLHILATVENGEGMTAFAYLLENMARESVRVWATGAPFHTKDLLKGRGYHWNDGTDGRHKAWHKAVSTEELPDEMAFIREKCGGYPQTTSVEAIDRYSIRER